MGPLLIYAGIGIGAYFLLTSSTGCGVDPNTTVDDINDNGVPVEPINPEDALIEYDSFSLRGSYFMGAESSFVTPPIPLSVTRGIPQLGVQVSTDSKQIEVDGQSIPDCLDGLINTTQIENGYCTEEDYVNFRLALCPNDEGNRLPFLLSTITIERLRHDPQEGYVLSTEPGSSLTLTPPNPSRIGAWCEEGSPSPEDANQILVNIPTSWYDSEDPQIRVRITPALDPRTTVDSLQDWITVLEVYIRSVPEVVDETSPQ